MADQLKGSFVTKWEQGSIHLESLQAEDLQELEGYKRVQLVTVWDRPDEKVSSEQEVWVLDEKRVFLVTYDEDGTVKEADIQQSSKNQYDTD